MNRRTFLTSSSSALLSSVVGHASISAATSTPVRKPDDFVNGTWEHLFYPPAGYKYFDGSPPDFSNGNDPSIARWMVDAAMLAYCQDGIALMKAESLTPVFRGAGFDYDPSESWVNVKNGTHAFFVQNAQCGVISFRGTERGSWKNPVVFPDALKNLLTDGGSIIPVLAGDFAKGAFGAMVPLGFKAVLSDPAVRTKVDGWIRSCQGKEIFLTGHSLGGALATLTAARATVATNLYTFGCPAIGTRQFCDYLSKKTKQWQRYVDRGDAVTHVPPLFTHGGDERKLNSSAGDNFDPFLLLPAFAAASGVADALLNRKIPDDFEFLADHSPSRYIYYVWNE
jgi:hypothetical protein